MTCVCGKRKTYRRYFHWTKKLFKDRRETGKLVPSKVGVGLKERYLRIIWATWHLSTFLVGVSERC